MKFASKEAQNSTSLHINLNGTQQPGRIFVLTFHLMDIIHDFQQLPLLVMDALEPYYFEPNMLQTPKMITLKVVKWIIAWEKHILLAL